MLRQISVINNLDTWVDFSCACEQQVLWKENPDASDNPAVKTGAQIDTKSLAWIYGMC